MFQFPPRIYLDFTSFWIGAIIVILSLILYIRLRSQSDKFSQWITERVHQLQDMLAARTSRHLRQKTLEFAQSQHLSSDFCSLDDILILPKILASPHQLAPDGFPPDPEILQMILPYTADYPEFAAEYRYPTLSLADALKNGANLAILGRPGSGKTVALSHLASQMARKNIQHLKDWEPLFIDANHLVDNLPGDDPLPLITSALNANAIYRQAGLLEDIVKDIFAEEKAFIILDSVDQLPRKESILAINFIKTLQDHYPWVRIVTTAVPRYFDGLLETSLVPIALATWGTEEKLAYANKWCATYQEYGAPGGAKTLYLDMSDPEDRLLFDHWLFSSKNNPTPLEFSLMVWGIYAGDGLGSQTTQAIEAYLRRMMPNLSASSMAQLEEIALAAIMGQQNSFSLESVHHWLYELYQRSNAPSPGKPIGEVLKTSQEAGILSSATDNKYRFLHPSIAGYLAGKALSKVDLKDEFMSLFDHPWPARSETFRFAGSFLDNATVRSQIKKRFQPNSPLAWPLIDLSHLLSFLPPKTEVRDLIRKTVTKEIINNPLLETKLRLANILATSGDPDTESIFRFLLKSHDPDVRQVAILGCGFMRSSKSTQGIIDQLGTDSMNDRASCFALVNIGTPQALEAVANLLLTGDEKIRQAAAESLANHPREGHPTLKDASEVDQLTIRRAAVHGLKRIDKPWAKNILDEMRIEDEEWLVRNAAQQVFEAVQGQSPYIPSPPIPKEDLPWIADVLEEDNHPEEVSYQVLLKTLLEGTPEQIKSALQTIRNEGFGSVFPEIYHALFHDRYAIRRTAADTLWHLSLTGMDIPLPDSDFQS